MKKISAQVTVKYIPPGEPGPLPYPAGIWNKDATYIRTKGTAPFIYYDTGNPSTDIFYLLNKEGTFKGIDPKADYAVNGKNATWVPFENYLAIFTKILMANFGLTAGAVFHDNKLFSQYGILNGVDSQDYQKFGNGFIPNLLLNWLTGKFVCKDAEIEGFIKALRGFIGKMSIDEIGLYSDNMMLTDEMIQFKEGENRMVELGTPSILGFDYMGRIENKEENILGTNVGIFLNVVGAAYNLAFYGNGSLVSEDLVAGCGYKLYTFNKSNQIITDTSLRLGQNLIVSFTYDKCGLALPSLTDVQRSFGRAHNSVQPFSVNVTVVSAGSSTKNGYVYGRTPDITFLNSNQYPYLRDNNYNDMRIREMGRGDVHEFLLVYTGSIYDAYWLNSRG